MNEQIARFKGTVVGDVLVPVHVNVSAASGAWFQSLIFKKQIFIFVEIFEREQKPGISEIVLIK
jgi:hypothetical protein